MLDLAAVQELSDYCLVPSTATPILRYHLGWDNGKDPVLGGCGKDYLDTSTAALYRN